MKKPRVKILYLALAVGCIAAGSGCMNKRVVFATKTNLGLDVSGTAQYPDKVSFTYGRYEGAIVPRGDSGEEYSVYGALDADVRFFGAHTIEQVFATGEAAKVAANGGFSGGGSSGGGDGAKEPLLFVTDTSYGLKLSVGKQDISPTLMLGYKRVEGTVIPVKSSEAEVRSVYADLTINSSTDTKAAATAKAFPANKGVRIVQRFATGQAAVAAAQRPDVQQYLLEKTSPANVVAAQGIIAQEEPALARLLAHLSPDGQNVDRTRLNALASEFNDIPDLKRKLTDVPAGATRADLETHLRSMGGPIMQAFAEKVP